jgi:ribosome silencing factor RsfS/YbeB/iojap
MAAKKKTPAKKKPALKKKPVAKAAKKAAPAKKAGAPKKPAAKGKTRRPVRASKRPSPRRKVAAAKKPRAQAAKKAPLPAAPEAFALAKTIAQVAGDKKAENVVVIDTRSRSSAVGYDYLVLATGESDRQLSAIQEGVDELVKPQGKRPGSVEASADWVCVTWDEGVVAHFFTADRRELMDLEGLWAAAPRVTL